MIEQIKSWFFGSKPTTENSASQDTNRNAGSSHPASRRQRRPVIQTREQIPAHESVLTVEDGPIQVTDNLRQRYAVMLASKDSGKIIIAVSSDVPEVPIDNNVEYLKSQCLDLKFDSIKGIRVSPSILGIIYEQGAQKTKSQKKQEKSAMQKKVYDLLHDGLDQNASDIHLEVREDSAITRFRKNSKLIHHSDMAIKEAENLAGLIYRVIAKEKAVTFNAKEQQSAIIDKEIRGTRARIRLNTTPAYPGGFDMVMRLLRMGSTTGVNTVENLGYSIERGQVDDIKKMVAQPTGVIIVAGVTGSGKSTTNSVLLERRIDGEITPSGCGIKVITVEDPPEYVIEHATQIPVNSNQELPNGKSPFAAAMKAALRCDPDIMMVGEVRDEQSAELMVRTVLSGHQVYTTLHAQSAFSVIARLQGLGVPLSVLGGKNFISGLIYQTLVPITCHHCAHSFDDYVNSKKNVDPDLIKRLNNLEDRYNKNDIIFRNTSGCKNCDNGITGMTVVAETVLPTETMFQQFSEGRINDALFTYRENGGHFAVDHGIDKVLDGLICPIDAEGRLGPLVSTDEILETIKNENTKTVKEQPLGEEA